MGQLYFFRWACCVSLLLCIVPLAWHWQNKNTAACFLIIWLSIFNLCSFINSFIWPDDIAVLTGWEGGIYCDIQIKILIAGFTGHLGAMAAIARNLAVILSDDAPVVRTRAVRRRELYKDLALCLAVPILMMAVHYIVQPRRYTLVAITGCTAAVDRSWPTVVLIFIWPPIVALMAGYYAALVVYRLHKHRRRFDALLSGNSSLNRPRFVRLFVLSMLLLLIFVPITFYVFVKNMNLQWLPYSWDAVHYGTGWMWIRKIPTNGYVNFDRWIPVGSGIIVFLIFGVGKDAMDLYRGWLSKIGIGKLGAILE
ncbi:GPCR fungal pheromone mating factor [Sphaerosporella brunnea]|uniref:GPCR fungal pheromone mating factor n=1 Tax=Sphaerosporella brunnea TaxID=1250544 RepID=A0A5J5F451_9PEZI|nr:GPCR fungal pheromone mating factor [Sphaerosporella brunnea]